MNSTETVQTICNVFDIQYLTTRYLCGETALKELRPVHRTRLFTEILSPGIDAEASELNQLIYNYQSAAVSLSSVKKISIASLLNAQQFLVKDRDYWGIRANDIWIGGFGKKHAVYNAPDSSKAAELLERLINYMSFAPKVSPEKIYMEFVTVHPFRNGNGRTARLLYGHFAGNNGPAFVHPVLFRLHCSAKFYASAHENYRQCEFSEVDLTENLFWQEAWQWQKVVTKEVQQFIKEFEIALLAKHNESSLTDPEVQLLKLLVNQPLFSFEYLMDNTDQSPDELITNVSALINRGLVSPVASSMLPDETLFAFEHAFRLWNKIDHAILREYQFAEFY